MPQLQYHRFGAGHACVHGLCVRRKVCNNQRDNQLTACIPKNTGNPGYAGYMCIRVEGRGPML